MIALVFRYEVRDTESFEAAYGPHGDWARFFRRAAGYIGTELLHDVSEPDRYLVIDRWATAEAYNAFHAANQEEYLQRADDARLHYLQELRFGTFESVWHDDPQGPPAA